MPELRRLRRARVARNDGKLLLVRIDHEVDEIADAVRRRERELHFAALARAVLRQCLAPEHPTPIVLDDARIEDLERTGVVVEMRRRVARCQGSFQLLVGEPQRLERAPADVARHRGRIDARRGIDRHTKRIRLEQLAGLSDRVPPQRSERPSRNERETRQSPQTFRAHRALPPCSYAQWRRLSAVYSWDRNATKGRLRANRGTA